MVKVAKILNECLKCLLKGFIMRLKKVEVYMKEIKRDVYLNRLINRKDNGLIKIITGIRRCGKSYLLDPLFKNYLIENGVKDNHIIKLELDKEENKKYRDSHELNKYIKSLIKDKDMYYILLDEIQMVDDFESVLNGFLYERNLDVYVTGSNSKFLSTDIITEFRGRGDEIKVFPLSFSEYVEAFDGDKYDAWNEYVLYGGLPLILSKKTDEEKSNYLKDLFEHTYIKDIIERNNIQRVDVIDSIINMLASSVGSLTNPKKIYDTFVSNGEKEISPNTINSYIKYIEDSFVVVAATNNKEINHKIGTYCNQKGKLVNVVDDKNISNFTVPSYVKRGELLLSISTGGNSPSLSAKIKRELEETYDESYEEYIELLGLARKRIIEENKDIRERRKKIKALIELSADELKEKI